MMRWVWFILVALVLGGCTHDAQSPGSDGFDTEASDPDTGVVIRTHIESNQITTADRVRVIVDVQWTPPASALLIEPDWEESGWTLIDRYEEPTQTIDTGFLSTNTYVIEPFLAGQYTIPGFGVEITPSLDAQPSQIESVVTEVEVRSVLDAEDAVDLAPADGYIDPRAAQEAASDHTKLIAVLIVAGLICAIIIIWRLTRTPARSQESFSVYALLKRVSDGQGGEESDAYATLQGAFNRLDARLQQTSEIRTLIDQCERARFSTGQTSELDPQTLARHTLALLGCDDGEMA